MSSIGDAGSVFGLIILILFTPLAIGCTYFFWKRKDIQPIKARSPGLVVINDVILILYVALLCFQRIFADDYPCLLTLWSGHVGTILLLNVYLCRCWTLYYTFHLTQERVLAAKDATRTKRPSFFMRNKHLIGALFLFKLFGIVTVVLVAPCGILTATNPELAHQKGEPHIDGDNGCRRMWGDTLLAVYVACYIVCFIYFGFSLRAVVDGFKIKSELKATSLVCLLAVIPWFVFNNLEKEINRDTFPFSTLALIVAAVAAFVLSTVVPLYRSLSLGADVLGELKDVPEDLTSLRGLLQTSAGFESFKKFLTKEFSVENILFWAEVDSFRRLTREAASISDCRDMAHAIYQKYIENDAPFMVNLPSNVTSKLNQGMRHEYGMPGSTPEDHVDYEYETHPSWPPEVLATPTIFDAAQNNIFLLMHSDSFKRFQGTEEYKSLVAELMEKQHTRHALAEMNLI